MRWEENSVYEVGEAEENQVVRNLITVYLVVVVSLFTQPITN
jgi:hypothetical protein